ncbi:unnamed protein product [Clonostachys chloroleuca]|uniref:Uncharacterized protein n=1 Tax=Clonostachys chloroleuca TaxID=1926264 RepID=A0AA35LTH0_9HYPO|nr:unnamed protein product [Clonostachys chloroleuca]
MAMRITRSRIIQRKSNRCRRPTWKVQQAGSWNQLLEDAGLSPRTPAIAQSLGVLGDNTSSPTNLTQGAAQPLGVGQENASRPADLAQGAASPDTTPVRKSFIKFSANNPNGMVKGGAPTEPTPVSIMDKLDLDTDTGLTLGFLNFDMKETDAIERRAFTLSDLNLDFHYWYFRNRLTPIDKSLQRSIDSAYKEGDWSAIKNAIRREFGRDMDGEQQAQFTKKFSELSDEDRLSIVRILERRGYCALDRDKWID